MTINYWEKGDFELFLRHLVEEEGYTAHAIIEVALEPYKWEKDYLNWVANQWEKGVESWGNHIKRKESNAEKK